MGKLFLFGMILIVMVGCDTEQKRQADQAAWDDLHAKAKREIARIDLETDSYKEQLVELKWGSEAGRLWAKCRIPPKDTAHQRACNALHDRYDKYRKAEDAKTQAEAAKW
jgi:hypothetical protein